MIDQEVSGLKLIRHNAGGVDEPDDPSFPFKLEAGFRPPEFMSIAFIGLHGGTEEIVVRAMTREILENFIGENRLRNHPRLRTLVITGPDGIIEKLPA